MMMRKTFWVTYASNSPSIHLSSLTALIGRELKTLTSCITSVTILLDHKCVDNFKAEQTKQN